LLASASPSGSHAQQVMTTATSTGYLERHSEHGLVRFSLLLRKVRPTWHHSIL
jgi:hypothetical protein